MMGHILRVAALISALFVSVGAFAQGVSQLSPQIIAQINQSAATQSTEAFAQTITALALANPEIAAAIVGKATETRPAAATSMAQSLAAVIPPAQAQTIVSAIVNALPAADRGTMAATVINSYIGAAPPSAQAALTVALAPVLAAATQPAAGGQNQNQNQNDTKTVDIQDIKNTVKGGDDSHPSPN